MADVFELDYLYSRVCGAYSKAFLGSRGAALASCRNSGELWKAVFGTMLPERTGPGLVREAERRITQTSLADFRKLSSILPCDDRFIGALGRKIEYSWIKSIGSAIRNGAPECPPNPDEGHAPGFEVYGYPDPTAMFSRGRYSWIEEGCIGDRPVFENRLDRQYYRELGEAINAMRKDRSGGIPGLVRLEAELHNVVWTLRLRHYYGFKDSGAVRDRLIELPGVDVASHALECMQFATDRRQDWAGWKWEKLLGRINPGADWKLDVREAETAARRLVFRSVKKSMHIFPATYTPFYCHFKMKEFETALISGLFEGMAIGAPSAEIAAYAYSVTGGLP